MDSKDKTNLTQHDSLIAQFAVDEGLVSQQVLDDCANVLAGKD